MIEESIETPQGDHVDLKAATTAIATEVAVISSISTTVVRLARHPSCSSWWPNRAGSL